MPRATVTRTKSPAGVEAEKLCRQFPDVPTRTLARRIAKECKITTERARSIIRTVRGQNGEAKRRLATVPKAAGKAGTKPQMPPSISEEWTPFDLEAKRVGIISDVHVPYHSTIALAAAIKTLKTKKPDCILINGDYGDFYSISRWQKNPKKRDLEKELDLQKQGLEWIRSEFPKARLIFKLGNHEERWDHWLWNCAPEISDHPRMRLSAWLEFQEHGIELVADQRPVMAGKLPILHGHEKGKGVFSPVNQARGAFMRLHHTVLEGHGHRTSGHCEPDMFGREVFCWSTGCLCDLRPEYCRIANKWNWGFAFVSVATDGTFDVDNLRVSENGTVRKS